MHSGGATECLVCCCVPSEQVHEQRVPLHRDEVYSRATGTYLQVFGARQSITLYLSSHYHTARTYVQVTAARA